MRRVGELKRAAERAQGAVETVGEWTVKGGGCDKSEYAGQKKGKRADACGGLVALDRMA